MCSQLHGEGIGGFIGNCVLRFKDVKFEFVPTPNLQIGSIVCTGEAVKGRLTIATGGSPDVWIPVFVHEVCHLEQRRDNSGWFDERDLLVGKLDRWLSGVDSDRPTVPEMNAIVELEHDCETRTLLKIRDCGLPIGAGEYAKKANAYLLSYSNTYASRAWDSTPYTKPEIWVPMPSNLQPLPFFWIKPPILADSTEETN